MQKYVRIGISLLAAALTIVRLPAQSAAPASIYSPYIFAWIGDGQRQSSDFLAVIDADPKSSSYGRLVATLPAQLTSRQARPEPNRLAFRNIRIHGL